MRSTIAIRYRHRFACPERETCDGHLALLRTAAEMTAVFEQMVESHPMLATEILEVSEATPPLRRIRPERRGPRDRMRSADRPSKGVFCPRAPPAQRPAAKGRGSIRPR